MSETISDQAIPPVELPIAGQRVMQIALVDDDRNILTTVAIALQAEGFATRLYSA
jgi:two-component system, OmpR family, response regulator ChvI